MTTTDTPNIAASKAFLSAVINGKAPEITECRCESVRELLDLLDRFNKSLPFMAQKGKPCRVRGINDISRNGFTVHVAGHVFQVNPPGKAPKKGVSQTSRMAYKSIDKNTLVIKVAKAVIELHKEYPLVSDNLVAPLVDIPAGRVSARRNEIEAAGSITIDGVEYNFHGYEKIKCPVTGNTVQGWALRKANTLF